VRQSTPDKTRKSRIVAGTPTDYDGHIPRNAWCVPDDATWDATHPATMRSHKAIQRLVSEVGRLVE
jgi:hypothetical protein